LDVIVPAVWWEPFVQKCFEKGIATMKAQDNEFEVPTCL